MLLLDYQNVLIESLLRDRINGCAIPRCLPLRSQVANSMQGSFSQHRPGRVRLRRRHIPHLDSGEQEQDLSVDSRQVLPGAGPIWRAVGAGA
jgi:hypothetical protein